MNRIEMVAVARLAVNMAHADGRLDKHEVDALANGFAYFGIGPKDSQDIVLAAGLCSNEDAEAVVSGLSDVDKEFVSAWLLAVVAADGVVNMREKAYFQHLVASCGLLNLSLDSARSNVTNRTIVCYRVVCGTGDYDFRTMDEAQKAVQELSGYDTRPAVLAMFKIKEVQVEATHKFRTLADLHEQLRREDEEWLNQPMFIANDVDTYLKGIASRNSQYY